MTDRYKTIISYTFLFLVLIVYYFFNLDLSFYENKDFIAFLDVGTGDSILIGSKGEYALVDGGPSYYNTNDIYKYTKNKKPLAYFITHPHSDHISGILKLLQGSTYYDLFLNKFNTTKNYENILLKKFQAKSFIRGDKAELNNFTIYSLYPDFLHCDLPNINNCSMVLLVVHQNGQKVLLMSDLEASFQSEIINDVGDVNIIKVPHQGAGDSLNKELLQKALPESAVISVGVNSYGHPSKEVLDYYKSQDIKIYRTDTHGDVVFVFE